MLAQAVAVINGKGGTYKTSLVANVGGLIADAGYKVLLVDMDPQGNLGRDLGYLAAGTSDEGRAMFDAVISGRPLEPLRGVRPNLDVICGGKSLEDLAGALSARITRGEEVTRAVRDQLAPLASQYHLILIDCPPGNRQLQHMALAASHYVIIPTKPDEASLDGLAAVAALFQRMRQAENPALELLGVVLVGIGARSSRIEATARDTIAAELADPDLVFNTVIRHLEGPAADCRRRGQVVFELENDVAASLKSIFDQLRQGERGGGERLSATAKSLAENYTALAAEITERISARAAVDVPA